MRTSNPWMMVVGENAAVSRMREKRRTTARKDSNGGGGYERRRLQHDSDGAGSRTGPTKQKCTHLFAGARRRTCVRAPTRSAAGPRHHAARAGRGGRRGSGGRGGGRFI